GTLQHPLHHQLHDVFIDAVDAELVAPELVLDTGMQPVRGAPEIADVDQQLRRADDRLLAITLRAGEVDEAAEAGLHRADTEGNQPGRRDLPGRITVQALLVTDVKIQVEESEARNRPAG